MGYGVDFPLSRLGKAIILWVIRVYGLPEVWVKRVSTVVRQSEATLQGGRWREMPGALRGLTELA